MIKTIIKLDGSTEPFDASKVNGWGEWAATKLGDKVDWSSIVMDAVHDLGKDTVTSQELQQALIDQCLNRKTWSYYLMAGRLYAVLLRKKLYGNAGIPSIKALHTKLFKAGLMSKLNYSSREYEEIQGLIRHDLDLDNPHFALHHIRSKYARQNRKDRFEYETAQFVYMRMAMALSENEPAHRRMEDVKNYYWLLSNKKMSAPTPNYINLGTEHKGFASCCLFASADEGESLAMGNYIADIMTQNSAGMGANIMSRSIGDAVRGGSFLHKGKLPYYTVWGKSVICNEQNGRGGAGNLYYTCYDPEAYTLAMLRDPRQTADKQNRDVHFSMIVNKHFVKKVGKNEQIFTWNGRQAPDLETAFYAGDPEAFEALYNKYEADPTFQKNYVSARELMLEQLDQAYKTGTAYWINIDEGNRHTPFKDPIYSSNLCVAPETKILTDKGYVEIKSVAGTKQNVWNGEEWSEVDVVKTGENQKLLLVLTDSGQEIECTPAHKFYVVNGYGTAPIEKRAHELQAGDKLIKFDLPVIQGTESLDKAYVNGFYSGDGCDLGDKQRVYLYGSKRALVDEFPGVEWRNEAHQNRMIAHYTDLQNKFFVPDNRYTVTDRLNWLAGYADADGTICRNGDNQQLSLASVNYAFLKSVQAMLNTLGVSGKLKVMRDDGKHSLPMNDGSGSLGRFECQRVYRLLVTSVDLQSLVSLGFSPKRLKVVEHVPQRNARQFVKITAVLDYGRVDDTYCFSEPKRHMGVFNGLLTGQCTEIFEPTIPYRSMMDLYSTEDHGRGEIATCSLGAIPVDNIENDEEYRLSAYYSLKMIDYCIMNAHYSFPHLKLTAQSRMSAGVGIMGLATHMARNQLSYASDAGKHEIHFIYERHMYMLIEASLRISQERGLAPWMHKTKWPEGWLPIDTYNKNVDKIVEGGFSNYMPWEKLRARIVENGGIGHSVVCTHMPGEASSKALGGTNSGYPIRRANINKSDQTTVVQWAAPFSDDPAYKYDIAWEVPTKDMADCYGIMQKWTDQGISADLYRRVVGAEKITAAEMLKDFIHCNRVGMKGRYYQNTETTANLSLEALESAFENNDGNVGCASGACTL